MRGKTVILFFFLFILTTLTLAQAQNYFKIELSFNLEEISLISKKVTPQFSETQNRDSGYLAELVSIDGHTLNVTTFGFSNTIFYESIDSQTGEKNGGGITILNQSTTTIYLPYFPNAKQINIYDQDLNQKLSIPLTQFAKEKITPEKLPTEAKPENTKPEKNYPQEVAMSILYVIVGMVVILLLVIFFIIISKKQEVPPSP